MRAVVKVAPSWTTWTKSASPKKWTRKIVCIIALRSEDRCLPTSMPTCTRRQGIGPCSKSRWRSGDNARGRRARGAAGPALRGRSRDRDDAGRGEDWDRAQLRRKAEAPPPIGRAGPRHLAGGEGGEATAGELRQERGKAGPASEMKTGRAASSPLPC